MSVVLEGVSEHKEVLLAQVAALLKSDAESPIDAEGKRRDPVDSTRLSIAAEAMEIVVEAFRGFVVTLKPYEVEWVRDLALCIADEIIHRPFRRAPSRLDVGPVISYVHLRLHIRHGMAQEGSLNWC